MSLGRVIRLRAHHLRSIDEVSKMGLDHYTDVMISNGYALSREDPFIRSSLSFVHRLLDNPETRVRLVVGKADKLCRICKKRAYCFRKTVVVGDVFWRSQEDSNDAEYLEDMGLKHRDILTFEEAMRLYAERVRDVLPEDHG